MAMQVPAYASEGEDVTELFLCEARRLILKPDILYRFKVDEHCRWCRRDAVRAEPGQGEPR